MTRRFCLLLSTWMVMSFCLTVDHRAERALANEQPIAAQVAGLKDQLEKGLRARFPRDFEFIAYVVDLVEMDQLPRSLVQGTFHWVRKHKQHKRYLVPYFERALRERAEKLGFDI